MNEWHIKDDSNMRDYMKHERFVIQLENIRRDALVSTGGATSSIATAEVDSDDRSSNKKHN